jgi:hypothetical protein
VCGLEEEISRRHVAGENIRVFSSKERTLKMRRVLPL